MAQGRMLLNRISESEKLNALSDDTARLLYTWLLSHLDCNGNHLAHPTLVKSKVFPWRDDIEVEAVENYLDEMENVGLIVRYSDGKYLHYPDFEDKQPNIRKDREAQPKIPSPTPAQLRSNVGDTQERVGHKLNKSKLNKSKLKQEEKKDESKAALFSFSKDLKKIFPEADKFVGRMLKTGKNKDSIAHALRRLKETKPTPKEPWAFCLKIVSVESGNYNEKEVIKKHKQIDKRDLTSIGDLIPKNL